MHLKFHKMQSLGNDFVLIDNRSEKLRLAPEQLHLLADRHHGIGCDQVLVLEDPASADADVHCGIFNADGKEAEQCGNGMRCVALYLRLQAAAPPPRSIVSTAGALVTLYPCADGAFRAELGIPRFEPGDIPLCVERRRRRYPVLTPAGEFHFNAVSIGNPHAVVQVGDSATAPVALVGGFLEANPLFPRGVNTGFMQVVSEDRIHLRVYERGVGETLACGSGACAAVVAGRYNGDLCQAVSVSMPGGELQVEWEGEGHSVWLGGPAAYVFEGNIDL